MRKKTRLLFVIACTIAQFAWSQVSTSVSTALEVLVPKGIKPDVSCYKFNYPSVNAAGEEIVLSSALMVWNPESPQEGDAIEAVHIHCHYTITSNDEAPTNMEASLNLSRFKTLLANYAFFNREGEGLEGSFRDVITRGIMIIPDYEGYGVTSSSTHPYLAQELTAHQVVDAVQYGLTLYRQLVDEGGSVLPLSDNWRTFCFGYSQGGAVALAVQRYIEEHHLTNALRFRGSVCGDGPYDLIATLRYYLNNTIDESGEGYVTMPAVMPMILKGMIASDPSLRDYSLSDYLSEQFLATGVEGWINSKNMTTDAIDNAFCDQLEKGIGSDYTPEAMATMFSKQQVSGKYEAWAKLSAICTPEFYAYLSNADNFNNVPTSPSNAYEAMHRALANNSLCTGWTPKHRIQFVHSTKDEIVPYDNYTSFRDAHPDDENTLYRIDNSSTDTHETAGTNFVTTLSVNHADDFAWIDAGDWEDTEDEETGIFDVRGKMEDGRGDGVIYNIAGQRLNKPQRGIYIHNGRKIVIK